jgi:histone H3/H4
MGDLLIVRSKIKDVVLKYGKEKDVKNVATNLAEALNVKVEQLIADAVKRAILNKRRTVEARDI